MPLIDTILNSSLDGMSKQQVTIKYTELINTGVSEKEAYIQALTELKEQEENNLEQLYNQLQ